MKKSIILMVLTAVFLSGIAAEGVPSWFSEDVKASEKQITRKNPSGEWVPFIDKKFNACAFVKVSDDVLSLYDARDKAEQKATEKLDAYLKSKKENEALKCKHELTRYSFDRTLETGGAYVEVEVVYSYEKPGAAATSTANTTGSGRTGYKKEIAEMSSKFPRVLMYGTKRLTLVDNMNIESAESLDSHKAGFVVTGPDNKQTKESNGFYYPDGVLVHDTTYTFKNEDMTFTLRNVIKGRRTVILIRYDDSTKNDKVTLSYKNRKYTSKTDHDSKNRWRNAIIDIDEGVLTEYSPMLRIEGSDEPLSIGEIVIYQEL